MSDTLKFDIKLKQEDYITYSFYNYFKSIVTIVSTFLGICLWALVILWQLKYYDFGLDEFPTAQVFMATFLTILVPLFTYVSALFQYKMNPKFQEIVSFEIDAENIKLQGQSFESKFTWKSVYKIKETKPFFFLFFNRNIANLVPKNQLKTAQINKLRELIKIANKS